MKNLALFDLDHTLIPVDSDREWGRFAAKVGIVEPGYYARQNEQFHQDYANGTLDIYAYLDFVLSALAQHPLEQLNQWRAQYMQECILPYMQTNALDLVKRHQDAGDLCCIVTATNEFVTQPIALAFGIHALIGCQVEVINNQITGRYSGIPSFQDGKIKRTEMWLAEQNKTWQSFERTYFYSDSHNDLPLLNKVSHPVATNPDSILRQHAISKKWPILDLFALQ